MILYKIINPNFVVFLTEKKSEQEKWESGTVWKAAVSWWKKNNWWIVKSVTVYGNLIELNLLSELERRGSWVYRCEMRDTNPKLMLKFLSIGTINSFCLKIGFKCKGGEYNISIEKKTVVHTLSIILEIVVFFCVKKRKLHTIHYVIWHFFILSSRFILY